MRKCWTRRSSTSNRDFRIALLKGSTASTVDDPPAPGPGDHLARSQHSLDHWFLPDLLLLQEDGVLEEIPYDLIHIAAVEADLCELGGLHLRAAEDDAAESDDTECAV